MNNECVLYQDKNIIVANKLSGEICATEVLESQKKFISLVEKIKDNFLSTDTEFLECVNRLDVPVSGIVILAKNKASFSKYTNMLTNRDDVVKKYLAVVEGIQPIMSEKKILKQYIKFDTVKQKAYVYNDEMRKTKEASLAYRVFGHGDRYSFIEIELFTGRTHQIRSQLASIGLHIKGDVKYGARRADTIPGIRLHSTFLSFINPENNKQMEFSVLPSNMDSLWTSCVDNYTRRSIDGSKE